jgi:hypothetical protein
MSTTQLILIVLTVVALALSVWSAATTWSLNRLRRTFFKSRGGADLENILEALTNDLASTRAEQLELQASLAKLYEAFGFAVQKIGMVRFNPFEDGGGNFSFALALLDGHNNGVVITSMHGRQQNRIYSKYILAGKSEAQLTAEEQQAILQANNQN